ncbi:MAG TPA: carbohydrate porin [Steroidobacteraceae bacterium]
MQRTSAQETPAGAPEEVALGPTSRLPQLLGAQDTFILQHQSSLESPYASRLSLRSDGDTQPTNTMGVYLGWAPVDWLQAYVDVERFTGAGVSNATGLAGLTNGDVVREGAAGLKKEFYIARDFLRFMWPLTERATAVERAKDQVGGGEAGSRLELKVGRMAVTDDFDENRYAGDPRSEFLNWSLWANTAWDYAANTRGYTDGVVVGYISPAWSLKYGVYRMPTMANGQQLVSSLTRASGQNLQLTVSALPTGTIVRLFAYLNTASMGVYREALAVAAADASAPDIVADDRPGRQKHGYGLNLEQPLADDGESGVFVRWGWNDGNEESFAFTEVDRVLSVGGQLSGAHWMRPSDRLGVAVASQGLDAPHAQYLADGGSGFLLGDGHLNYGREQILESYYRIEYSWPARPGPIHWQLSPDFQFIENPGYNRDRGPVRFWGIRLHVEY